MSQRLVMPRKPLDRKLTDDPLGKERSTASFPAFPTRDGCGQSPLIEQAPAKSRG